MSLLSNLSRSVTILNEIHSKRMKYKHAMKKVLPISFLDYEVINLLFSFMRNFRMPENTTTVQEHAHRWQRSFIVVCSWGGCKVCCYFLASDELWIQNPQLAGNHEKSDTKIYFPNICEMLCCNSLWLNCVAVEKQCKTIEIWCLVQTM